MKYLFLISLLLFVGCSNDRDKYEAMEQEEQEILEELRSKYYEDAGLFYKYDLRDPDDRMKYGFDFDAQMKDKSMRVEYRTYRYMAGIYGYAPE